MNEREEQEKIEQMVENNENVVDKFEKDKKSYRYYSATKPTTIQCEKCGKIYNIKKLGGHYICKKCYQDLINRAIRKMQEEMGK